MMKGLNIAHLMVAWALSMQCATLCGQNTFLHTFGGAGDEFGRDVIELSTGGFLMVGTSNTFVGSGTQIYAKRVDAQGIPVWGRAMGPDGVSWGMACAEAANGHLYIAGFTNTGPLGGYDGILIELDADGVGLNTWYYGGSDWDFIHAMAVADNGDLLMCGTTYSNGEGFGDGWLLRVNTAGVLLWEAVFNEGEDEELEAIYALPDGGALLAGTAHYPVSGGSSNVWALRVDAAGESVWNRIYEKPGNDRGLGVTLSPVGDVAICGLYGESADTPTFGEDDYLVQVANYTDGDLLTRYNYGGIFNDEARGIFSYDNTRMVVFGSASSFGDGEPDAVTYGLTPTGGYMNLGTSINGTAEDDQYHSGKPTNNGSMIMFGETNGYDPNYQFYLILLDDSAQMNGEILHFVDLTSSQAEIEVERKNLIWPNPAISMIHIELAQRSQIDFYSISGRLLGSLVRDAGINMIDIRSYPAGIIIVQVQVLTTGDRYIERFAKY